MSAYKFPEFPYNRVGSSRVESGRSGNIGLKMDNQFFFFKFIMSDSHLKDSIYYV